MPRLLYILIFASSAAFAAATANPATARNEVRMPADWRWEPQINGVACYASVTNTVLRFEGHPSAPTQCEILSLNQANMYPIQGAIADMLGAPIPALCNFADADTTASAASAASAAASPTTDRRCCCDLDGKPPGVRAACTRNMGSLLTAPYGFDDPRSNLPRVAPWETITAEVDAGRLLIVGTSVHYMTVYGYEYVVGAGADDNQAQLLVYDSLAAAHRTLRFTDDLVFTWGWIATGGCEHPPCAATRSSTEPAAADAAADADDAAADTDADADADAADGAPPRPQPTAGGDDGDRTRPPVPAVTTPPPPLGDTDVAGTGDSVRRENSGHGPRPGQGQVQVQGPRPEQGQGQGNVPRPGQGKGSEQGHALAAGNASEERRVAVAVAVLAACTVAALCVGTWHTGALHSVTTANT